MRTKKQLLELLLDEWESLKHYNTTNNILSTLSGLVGFMRKHSKITFDEYSFLKQFIEIEFKEKIPMFIHQPRVEWLKKQIELCEKK